MIAKNKAVAVEITAAVKSTTALKNKAMPSEKGFTLVETIVAVTLVAMMAVGMWSIFRTGIRSWARGTEYIDASERYRNIMDLVRKQMASAYPVMTPTDQDSSGPPYPIFYGTETSLRFISLNSFNFRESPGLTFVNYEVISNSEGDYSLVESEQRYLGEVPDTEESADLPNPISLFDSLTECHFEYRKADDADNPGEWVTEWDSEEMQELPVAISMTMVTTDADGTALNRNIFVPVYAPEGNLQTNTLNLAGLRGIIGGGRGIRRELEEGNRRGTRGGAQRGTDSERRGGGRGMRPGRDSGTEPGMGPRRGRGMEPGRGRGMGPGMGRGMIPGMGPGMGRDQ